MRGILRASQARELFVATAGLAAALVTIAVVYPAWGRYSRSCEKLAGLRHELAELLATPLPPKDPVLPAVEEGPRESAQFLGEIMSLTMLPQVRFSAMETRTAPAAATKDMPVRPLRARIEVDGAYPQVRGFVEQIRTAPRLLVITAADVLAPGAAGSRPGTLLAPGDRHVHAILDVDRYVTPAINRTATTSNAEPVAAPAADRN